MISQSQACRSCVGLVMVSKDHFTTSCLSLILDLTVLPTNPLQFQEHIESSSRKARLDD